MTLEEIRAMPESDLHWYRLYLDKHLLPSKRIELMLAKQTYISSACQGAKLKFDDCLLDTKPKKTEKPQRQSLDEFLMESK